MHMHIPSLPQIGTMPVKPYNLPTYHLQSPTGHRSTPQLLLKMTGNAFYLTEAAGKEINEAEGMAFKSGEGL